jgi:hypothetical protein
MEAQLSAGIVRLKAATLNIPERDCCGEAVEGTLIPLTGEENSADRVKKARCLRHLERSAIEDVCHPVGVGETASGKCF